MGLHSWPPGILGGLSPSTGSLNFKSPSQEVGPGPRGSILRGGGSAALCGDPRQDAPCRTEEEVAGRQGGFAGLWAKFSPVTRDPGGEAGGCPCCPPDDPGRSWGLQPPWLSTEMHGAMAFLVPSALGGMGRKNHFLQAGGQGRDPQPPFTNTPQITPLSPHRETWVCEHEESPPVPFFLAKEGCGCQCCRLARSPELQAGRAWGRLRSPLAGRRPTAPRGGRL